MSRTRRGKSLRLYFAAVPLVVCLTGCDRDPDTVYGRLRGESLNGVSALVQLLRDSGRITNTRSRLGERMVGRHDVAIVFADSFAAPTAEARALLDRFLAVPGGQTLVFVVRDSDAAIDYWRAVADLPGLADDKAKAARGNLAEAESQLGGHAQEAFAAGADRLEYGLAARTKPVAVPTEVRMTEPGAGPVTARWPRVRRLEPPAGARSLWTEDGEPLLVERVDEASHATGDWRATPASDRTLILASAAPLLNAGLLDSGNRRLAQALVALLPPAGRVVVVGSAQCRPDREEEKDEPSTWRLLAIQPNPWIAAQALLAMVLFCWWKAPIFGRPHREQGGRPQDFGHHVDALAALVRRSGDDDFVQRRLEAWRRSGDGRGPGSGEIGDGTPRRRP